MWKLLLDCQLFAIRLSEVLSAKVTLQKKRLLLEEKTHSYFRAASISSSESWIQSNILELLFVTSIYYYFAYKRGHLTRKLEYPGRINIYLFGKKFTGTIMRVLTWFCWTAVILGILFNVYFLSDTLSSNLFSELSGILFNADFTILIIVIPLL